MSETGKGVRAYVTVRQAGNHHARVDHTGAVALCKAHAKPYEDLILNGVAPSPKASVHLVTGRPDIDAELQKAEAAGKGSSVCALCSHNLNWKPGGRAVAMADLAEIAKVKPA
jgi:hypothetical protein